MNISKKIIKLNKAKPKGFIKFKDRIKHESYEKIIQNRDQNIPKKKNTSETTK